MGRRNSPGGEDPDFPFLGPDEFFEFPELDDAPGDEPIGLGANLSPGMLLSAYQQGIFPWYSSGPVQWWSPDPRFVLKLDEVHFPKSLLRTLRRGGFEVRCDTAFAEVIRNCAEAFRPGQGGTWIMPEIQAAYTNLHKLGYAHSVETWIDGKLAGGLYGVSVGATFCGESMFSLADDASKLAFYHLVQFVRSRGIPVIDSQVHTDLFERFGAVHISRKDYLSYLEGRTRERKGPLHGSWTLEARKVFSALAMA